ncbi:hypothetical protein WA158_006296 [Blastocystis sp. Blastoise]
MQQPDYNHEYEEAIKLMRIFKYCKEYNLPEQIQEAVQQNKLRVVQSSMCQGVENVVFLTIDLFIPNNSPNVCRVVLTLMQQSFPLMAPVIHFIKYGSSSFNTSNSWIDNDGYLSYDIFKDYKPSLRLSNICDFLANLVKTYKLYISLPVSNSNSDPINSVPILNPSDFTYVKDIGKGGFAQCYQYMYKTISIYGLVSFNGRYMLVTNYASEGDLIQYMQPRLPSIQQYTVYFCAIFKKLASAVAAIHKKNIVHRDIKPGNIFMEKGDNPILGDFGLARVIDQSGSADVTRCGTQQYAAPELFDCSKPITNKCDIYSLGLVGYYILTGEDIGFEIFTANPNLKRNPKYAVPFNYSLNSTLLTLFQDCCQYNPDKRPSADEIVSRLSTYNGPLYEHFI